MATTPRARGVAGDQRRFRNGITARHPGTTDRGTCRRTTMIQTSLSTLLSSYLWGLMLLVGLIWLTGEWHRRHRRRLERRHDVICRLCHEIFRDPSSESLITCPNCAALNERRQPREL
jgi:hypothetical protein